jgi:YD repeat-containing protein
LNATTQYLSYDASGNATSIEDPNGNTTNLTYDAQDHLIETDGASGEKETRDYDADGKLTVDQKLLSGSTSEKTVNVYNANEDLVATRRYTDGTAFVGKRVN